MLTIEERAVVGCGAWFVWGLAGIGLWWLIITTVRRLFG